MEDRWLVFIGAGRQQIPSLLAAKKENIKILALDGDSAAPGFAIADKSTVVDISKPTEVLQKIKEFLIKPIGAQSFISEVGMRSAALVCDYYKLPGINLKNIEGLTNKSEQRRIWTEKGSPCPKWKVVSSLEEAFAAIEIIGYPAIIKPTESAGSRAVTRIDSLDDFEKYVAHALANSRDGNAIIEEFIVGQEYSVESFWHHGKALILTISERKLINSVTAYEIRTAQLTVAQREIIENAVYKSLKDLDFNAGPAHTEIILTADNRVFLVETAGRGGGFMVCDGLVPLTTSFDITRASVMAAVGEHVDLSMPLQKNFSILHYLPAQKGRLQNLEGFNKANGILGVIAGPLKLIGDVCQSVLEDNDRVGYILASAEDVEGAQQKLEMAKSMLSIEWDMRNV